MSLTIQDFGGRCEVNSISDLEHVLSRRYGPGVNGFWISHSNEEFPTLALLVNGNHAVLHYFPVANHPGFVSVGREEGLDPKGFTTFSIDTVEQETELWNGHVVDFSKAMAAAKDFFAANELPKSIDWDEL